MKRIIALLLTVIICLCMAACGKAPEPEQSPQEPHTEANDTEGTEEKPQSGSSSPSGNEAEKPEAPVQQSVELVGPWHLDREKNDLAAFADSLDLFELVMAFEEEYGIEIPTEELEGIETVGDIIKTMQDNGVA